MRYLSIIIGIFFLTSCKSEEEKQAEKIDYERRMDSITEVAKERVNQSLENMVKESMLDTIGLYKSPVKVISARMIKKDYSNYKDISLTYKNVSNKKIDAIKFRWYGLNAFGEPADMGSYGLSKGFGGGFTDDLLNPNKSRTSQWSILSNDGKKVVLAWAYEVAFSDGSKWECGKGK